MGNVIGGMTMSLDGYIHDRSGSVAALYPDLREFRETEHLQLSMQNTGAVVMGRHSYDMVQGDFTGYEYQVPIFVVTHHPPEQAARGQNETLRITFVDELKNAIQQAAEAAADKDVTVVGGASIIQQCLRAGYLDILDVGLMPVFLGGGLRLFEQMDDSIQLEKISVSDLPNNRTHIHYRIIK